MSARRKMQDIRQGMAVYTADGQTLGTVGRMQGDTLMVGGRRSPSRRCRG